MSEFKRGDDILWFEKEGKKYSGPEKIDALMTKLGDKEPYAVVTKNEKDEENMRLLRDCVRAEDMPPGLLPFIEGMGKLVGPKVPLTAIQSPSEDEPEATPTGDPLWFITEPADVPDGFDWSKMIGQPYHDMSRRVIGLVVRAGQGKIVVKGKVGMEKELREMIAGGGLPGSKECPEPKVGGEI